MCAQQVLMPLRQEMPVFGAVSPVECKFHEGLVTSSACTEVYSRHPK